MQSPRQAKTKKGGADGAQDALRPLVSLIDKSEKVEAKLAPGTWQHAMIRDNLAALRIAVALLRSGPGRSRAFTGDELEGALRALASMGRRTRQALAMFEPGTSQHSLQRNRLAALRLARRQVKATLTALESAG